MEVMMKKCIFSLIVLMVITSHFFSNANDTTQLSTSDVDKIQDIHTGTIKPNIQHGVNYYPVSAIELYYVSEKLDGVRGFWDGERLMTRRGNIINSPHWFTQNWPKQAIDGELWIERNKFEQVLSCVSKKQAEQNQSISCWREVRFMMFDLPSHKGEFSQRVEAMRELLTEVNSPYFAMISQTKFKSMDDIEAKLTDVIDTQGEGLMLHLASSHYKKGRNKALIKLKRNQDAEATVIGYSKGTGKYKNHVGALHVKIANGIVFKIGSGFTDKQRANPPELGSIITFKYNGLTQAGIPKFARFWRVKQAI